MKFKAVNKNKEFLRCYKKGQCYIDSLAVLYTKKNSCGCTRIGITSSKKVGNAVKRNRARRVIRESVRQLLCDYSDNIDIILVARGKTPYVKQQQVQQSVKKLFEKAGII